MITRIQERYWAWPGCVVVGDVSIGRDSNLWPFVCIRGDVAPIVVGERVSIQDHVQLHCRFGVTLTVCDEVVIGHHATVHGQYVGARTLVGINAVILDDCVIGECCLIAAGSVLRPGTHVAPGTMVAGVPAKVIRDVTQDEITHQATLTQRYVELARAHERGQYPSQL